MGRSGFATLLMLLIAALIVLFVVSNTTDALPGLWSKLTGQEQPAAPAEEVMTPRPMTTRPMTTRPMTTTDGMRQVEQTRRDLEAMDSLAQSVH